MKCWQIRAVESVLDSPITSFVSETGSIEIEDPPYSLALLSLERALISNPRIFHFCDARRGPMTTSSSSSVLHHVRTHRHHLPRKRLVSSSKRFKI